MFILGIILIIAGIGCAGYGFMQNNSLEAQFTLTPVRLAMDPASFPVAAKDIVIGVILLVVGIILCVVGKKKN